MLNIMLWRNRSCRVARRDRPLPVLTIEAMKEAYGTEFKACYVYLGPSIGPESFEVDVELGQAF